MVVWVCKALEVNNWTGFDSLDQWSQQQQQKSLFSLHGQTDRGLTKIIFCRNGLCTWWWWWCNMLVQNISRGHEILKTFWNFGPPYSAATAGAGAAGCSSHCLVLSVISMQASPPATQMGKFNSNTYLPILTNAKRLWNGAGGNVLCGNFSGRSCSAIQSSFFSSPWSTGSFFLVYRQSLHLTCSISSLVYTLYRSPRTQQEYLANSAQE